MDNKRKETLVRSLNDNDWRTQLMKPFIDEMITKLESVILTMNAENSKVQYSKHDVYRVARHYLINLKKLPISIIKSAWLSQINDMLSAQADERVKSYE